MEFLEVYKTPGAGKQEQQMQRGWPTRGIADIMAK